MCTNARGRINLPNIRRRSGHDVFYRVGWGIYRLYDPNNDPDPIYHAGFEPDGNIDIENEEND